MIYIPGNAQHVGARSEQQDSFGFSVVDDPPFVAHGGALAVVADGMGGLAHGRTASTLATRAFILAYIGKSPDESIPSALKRSLDAANDAVLEGSMTAGADETLGTTLAAAVVHEGNLHWISAGDSRVYLWRGNRVFQVTTDHVYAVELEAKASRGLISKTVAERDPDRASLVSYLGMPRPTVDRNEKPFPLEEADLVLVCSDGLYRALSEDEMAAIDGRDPQAVCESLVQRAIAKALAQQDNVTVAAIAARRDDGSLRAVDKIRLETTPRVQPGRWRTLLRGLLGVLLVVAALIAVGYARGWWPRANQPLRPAGGRSAPLQKARTVPPRHP